MTQFRVQVKIQNRIEPDLYRVTNNRNLSIRYLPSYVVAEKLSLTGLVLSRISSNIQVERGSPDK